MPICAWGARASVKSLGVLVALLLERGAASSRAKKGLTTGVGMLKPILTLAQARPSVVSPLPKAGRLERQVSFSDRYSTPAPTLTSSFQLTMAPAAQYWLSSSPVLV